MFKSHIKTSKISLFFQIHRFDDLEKGDYPSVEMIIDLYEDYFDLIRFEQSIFNEKLLGYMTEA